MSITNYTELQTAVSAWAHRSVAQVTDFIDLGETRINAALSSRLAEVEVELTGTIGSRYITLPTGYVANRGLWLTTYGNRIEIYYVPPEDLPVIDNSNSQPTYYTIDGANLAFDCLQSDAFTYTFRYKKGYDIASTTTNDMLTRYPNVYLYAALREASFFANDDNNAQKWEAAYQIALQECISSEFESKAMAILSVDGALLKSDRRDNIYTGGL